MCKWMQAESNHKLCYCLSSDSQGGTARSCSVSFLYKDKQVYTLCKLFYLKKIKLHTIAPKPKSDFYNK